jgi:hypothetical protein
MTPMYVQITDPGTANPEATAILTERRTGVASRRPGPERTREIHRPRFFRRAEVWVPTRAGWILALSILTILAIAFVAAAARLHDFLAENRPLPTDTLVVEGWLPDETLETVADAFLRGEYRRIVTVGGPIRLGRHLSPYEVSARLSAATLEKLGVPMESIVVLPTAKVLRDRTYEEALALKAWIDSCDTPPGVVNLQTLGVHARRSRILFQFALGDRTKVGVLAGSVTGYDPRGWWKSSEGAKTVLYETLAYVYTVLFFRPE